MTEHQHTSRRWRVFDGFTDVEIVTDRPTANETESIVQFKGQRNAQAHAELIVRAVNSHEPLVRACRLLAQAYDNGAESEQIDWDDLNIAHDAAELALAIADDGQQPPPDPEKMNGERAACAAAALRQFQRTTGCDHADSLGDLLCDLMHWSDRNGFDFEAALNRARGHYEAETTGGEPWMHMSQPSTLSASRQLREPRSAPAFAPDDEAAPAAGRDCRDPTTYRGAARPLRSFHLQENRMTTDASPSESHSAYLNQYEDHAHRVAEARPANKAVLFDALARAGITRVTVNFDGCGDSGQIEHINVHAGTAQAKLPEDQIEFVEPVFGDPEKVERSTHTVHAAIETMVYALLGETHGGWENDGGACGDFTFDVESRAITLDYNERLTEYDHSCHTF